MEGGFGKDVIKIRSLWNGGTWTSVRHQGTKKCQGVKYWKSDDDGEGETELLSIDSVDGQKNLRWFDSE
jgi:hypothetical protein